jgi:glycosyltransferase involved in cell wall biosynthesis
MLNSDEISSDRNILSFCIPTYGQPKHLRKTLQSLIGQNLEGVEILIRDDNLDSETERVVKEYNSKLPIKYFRMTKEGVDRAFIFLSKEARGKFVWWFGDDILTQGSFEHVLGFLNNNHNVDFAYINSTDYSQKNFSVQITDSFKFNNRNDVVSILKDQLGFCSAILLRRELLLTGLVSAEKSIGTSWVTFFLVLHVLERGEHFYFLNGANFFSEIKLPGESRWYDSFHIHGVNFSIVALKFKNKFNSPTIRLLLRDKFSRSCRAVVVERAMGLETGFAASKPNFFKLFMLYWSYPELYIALPMLLMPRFILKRLYKFYIQSRRIR